MGLHLHSKASRCSDVALHAEAFELHLHGMGSTKKHAVAFELPMTMTGWLFRCSDVPHSTRNEKVDNKSDRGDSREQF